ncbi:MAG: NAD(P)-binding domain-containing protein, partial [Alcaligenaceae bacterium]
MSTKIGFIGLGRMGKPMASHLQKKGFELIVLDLNQQAVKELVSLGAQAGQSIAEIASSCSVIITMPPSSVEVEKVSYGADGIFTNAKKGSILMDMSTIDPLATDRLSAEA